MYPKLYVDTAKITANVRSVVALCAAHGLKVVGVSKCVTADAAVAAAFIEGGVSAIGDSRVENLMRIAELPAEKWLIRTPSPADAARIVRYADLSLNSEPATLRALSAAAVQQGRTHKVVLMYDLGDLREGFVSREELMDAAQLCMELPGLQLAGVGANLNCLSFVQPDRAKMEELADTAAAMRHRWGLGDDFIVTGGNSASLHMLMEEGFPAGITDLRLGESLLIGKERACYSYLPGTFRDAFVIETEVVESKLKPSMPWGTIGPDSYGRVHSFEDRGPMQRAIVTGGNQDFDVEVMQPLDPRVRVVASSCDHTVLDVTDCAQDYPVGATVRLECGYHAILRAFTSSYVEKVYL